MAASVFGTVGEIEQFGNHRSFHDYAVPGSMDLFSGGRPPSQGHGFQIYQHDSKYPTNDVDRAISPKNMFGHGNLHSTHGWLPSSQPNWKMHPGSFGQSIASQQQNPPDLFTGNYPCEPSQIFHCDSGYETWDEPARSLNQNGLSRPQSSEGVMMTSPRSLSLKGAKMSRTESERFRFHTCLRASTAMVGDPSEAPESYLNKGQIYHLRVVDTTPPQSITETTRYRTHLRVSFKEQEQRMNAEAYWRLWKDSRGLAELDKKDCELRAVEYAGQNGPQLQVEQEFLDGFSVAWTINPVTGLNECIIPIRFNFLSTDFTLAKGVKGISVHLCAKTDQLNNFETPYQPEICFCNIRVFRDHGAERKLANDIANVQKRIKKLTEQETKAAVHEPPKKRKRGSAVTKNMNELNHHDPGWSMDLGNDSAVDPYSDKLRKKLTNLRNMLFSSCSESVLRLRGGKEDDPEMHITTLQLERSPGPAQRMISSRNSTTSLDDSFGAVRLGFDSPDSTQDSLSVANRVPNVSRRSPMPVACFYIYKSGDESPSERYYRTIYLRERTAQDLILRICEKCGVDASKVSRILHTDVNKAGIEILVDDDFVQQMTEGQDMIVKIEELPVIDVGVEPGANTQLGIWLEY